MEKDVTFNKMLDTKVPKLIATLSIPTIITMLVTNIYNMVDTAFVGRLGTSASGAVGIVFGYMGVLQAIGFMFGQGAGSMVSRRLGAGEIEEASDTASTGAFYAFVFAGIAAVLSLLFIDPLVMFLGSTVTIAPYAKTYILFIVATAPFLVTNFTLNNILRYEGKAFFGMVGMMSGAVLNILGDMLFMFVLNMGIEGAGLSTAISQVVSFVILLSSFLRGKTACRLSLKRVSHNFGRIFDISTTGFPSLLRQSLGSLTTIVLNMEAAAFGDYAVAGMSIVSRVFFFVFSVAIGVGQGFQPVSGYSYGAKRYDRLKEAYKFTMILSEILMLILGGLVFINASECIRLLRDDEMVIEVGTRSLQLHCLSATILPFCMVTEMLMQSTGKKLLASILSSLRSGVLFLPALLILARLRGLAGIQEAQPVAFVLSVAPSIYFAIRFFKQLEKE